MPAIWQGQGTEWFLLPDEKDSHLSSSDFRGSKAVTGIHWPGMKQFCQTQLFEASCVSFRK